MFKSLLSRGRMKTHEYYTGQSFNNYIIPEKWSCAEGRIETMDGKAVFSHQEHPLRVPSYSQPYSGEVTRKELFNHLWTHPVLPKAIPFCDLSHERDWGFCCSKEEKESMTDERYKVCIRTSFSFGSFFIGEMVKEGKNEQHLILTAHLGRTAQANDGLSGAVVGMEVMRHLQKKKNLRYSYRFLITPSGVGPLPFFQNNPSVCSSTKGILHLNFLGLDNPLCVQFRGSAPSLSEALRGTASGEKTIFFPPIPDGLNAQSSFYREIPIIHISRGYKPKGLDFEFFPEYHTHLDSPLLISAGKLQESRDYILSVIERIEAKGFL